MRRYTHRPIDGYDILGSLFFFAAVLAMLFIGMAL
jgi:hypothetical protein